MRYLQLTLSAVLLVFSCSSYAADYYRWTDSKGMTHFSDKPPQGVKAEKIRTGSKRPATTEETETAETAPNTSPSEARCRTERERLSVLKSNRLIQMKDAEGNNRTLSADEVNEEIAFTEKAVTLYCQD